MMLKKCHVIGMLCLLYACAAALAHGVEKTGVLVDAQSAETLLKNPSQAADHSVSTSLENQENGYGIIVKGEFHKFDDRGNKQALLLLKTTRKTKNLIVRVEGHFKDGGVTVHAIETVESLPER